MEEILKYQDIDSEIKKIEAQIADNTNRKNAIKMQQFLKDAQSKLVELEKRANDTIKAYNQYKEIYNKMAKNLEVAEKNAGSEDIAKSEGLLDAIETITNNLAKLDKEMASVIANCTSIQNEVSSIMKSARTAKSNMQKYKEEFAKYKAEMDEKIAELKEQLAKQAKRVDKTMLAKYKQKSQEKTNVFVPEVSGKCGGCRMEISASKLNTLKADGFIDCENCGRVIYLKKK